MLRKDREIQSEEEIFDVLTRCDTLRIGFRGEEYPYVVPVSFGVDKEDGKVVLYIHGARRGLKADLAARDSRVCVEGDILYRVEETHFGITARYESVIGFGAIEKVVGDEISVGLRAITAHYGYEGYDLENCKSLPMTDVYKITLYSLTGKRNLPKD